LKPAGLKAFAAREEYRSGIYTYEQRSPELPDEYGKKLKTNKKAWEFFQKQPDSYRKAMNWRILCAKKEETRQKRLAELIKYSALGERHPGYVALTKSKK
jgi:uncharacterized protein YdeI (YjbR/CyaY-like superfamily)